MEDHNSGKKKLKPHQVEHHQHKLSAYEAQLKELSRELDEEVRRVSKKKCQMIENISPVQNFGIVGIWCMMLVQEINERIKNYEKMKGNNRHDEL